MLGKRAAAVAATVAMAAGLGIGGSAAFAAPTNSQPNNEHIVISLIGTGNTISGPAAFTGFVNAVGTDVSSSNQDVIHLSGGTVVIGHHSLDEGGTVTEIGTSCVFRLHDFGAFHVVDGTGAYSNLAGSGTYTVNGTLTFQPNGTGGCNFNQAPLVAEVITANGRLHYT
jgi:hypothetical protein